MNIQTASMTVTSTLTVFAQVASTWGFNGGQSTFTAVLISTQIGTAILQWLDGKTSTSNSVQWSGGILGMPSGFSDGIDNTGSGGGFTFDGTNVTAYSTFSIQTPFGLASVSAASGISTFTVFGATNPYRAISLPAASWLGMMPSSASWSNSGFAISSPSVSNFYARHRVIFHEFINSTRAIAFTELQMPWDWDGSTVGFQVRWFASTGTLNTNVIWEVGGVAISSGDAAFPSYVSSSTVVSTYKAANQISFTDMTTLTFDASPLPGDTIGLFWTEDGGDGRDTFDGIARGSQVVINYRVSTMDGRPR